MKNKAKGHLLRRPYSRGEEACNAASHALGAVLALIGAILLAEKAASTGSLSALVSCIVYGASMVLLYSMSCLYHAAKQPLLKQRLRKVDHCSIFILIAGTYTPFAVLTLGRSGGYALLAAVWAIALAGVALNAVSVDKFYLISQAGYLVLGWAVLVLIKPLWEIMHPSGFMLLACGGICYTAGIIFYAIKKIPYFHTIWHLFVLGGSAMHFFSVYFHVL